jgi:hypothetical protein
MGRIVAIAVVGIFLAAPAFAQQAPSARQDWSSRVHVYAADYYAVRRGEQSPEYGVPTGGRRK